jgi:hypothetical protein
MRKTKNIVIIMILTLISIISCKTKTNSNISNQNQRPKLTKRQNEEINLHKLIKMRTKNYIEKYGVRKLLLDNNGVWYCYGEYFKFFSNGKVRIKFDGSYDKLAFWKVNNGKLYFNLNGLDKYLDNNFYEVKVEASVPPDSFFGYIKATKNIKYVINIAAKIKIIKSGRYSNYNKLMYHLFKE